MSLGEERVRLTFNPDNNDLVHQIKQKTAELIDLCESARGHAVGPALSEKNRCVAMAQTGFEDAAMCATKAVTTHE
jgi:hypothetical protein